MMIGSSDETVRVDLHLHSRASGSATNVWVKGLGDDGDVRESYALPEESYRMAKRAGMDFVTLTDHETIDGSLTLLHHPDFLVGDEVSARFPEDGGYADILLYGLDAGSHVEAQDQRSNIYDLVEYLREAGIVHVLAHPMYSVTKQAKSREPSRCGLSPRWMCRSMMGSIPAFHRSSMFWITSPKKSTTHCTWPPLARLGLQPSSLVFSLESRWSALTILNSVPTPARSLVMRLRPRSWR